MIITDGSGAPFVWQGQPAVMIMMRDVTPEAEADHRLRAKEELLRAIVENIPGTILIKDRDLRIRLASGQSYQKWSGMNAAAAIGKTAAEIVSKELAEELEKYDRAILESGEVAQVEANTDTADGQNRKIISTRFPVRDPSGKPIGVGIINQDVTDQRETDT